MIRTALRRGTRLRSGGTIRHRRKTLRIRRDPTDALHSLVVRTRDKWQCLMCGKQRVEGDQYLQACHIFRRGIPSTRWIPQNAFSMCALGCHGKFDRMDPESKLAFIFKHLDRETYEWLKVRALGMKVRDVWTDRRLATAALTQELAHIHALEQAR